MFLNGQWVDTLEDILPEPGTPLKILFIAKVPTDKSVKAEHYFRGKQGAAFWNKLKEYQILNVAEGEFEDDHLLSHDYGITDIAKVPRNFGDEPTTKEYKDGTARILALIELYKPKVLFFVYKRVLDNILLYSSQNSITTVYGFNDDCYTFFKTNVFVYPATGLRQVKADDIKRELSALQLFMKIMADNSFE